MTKQPLTSWRAQAPRHASDKLEIVISVTNTTHDNDELALASKRKQTSHVIHCPPAPPWNDGLACCFVASECLLLASPLVEAMHINSTNMDGNPLLCRHWCSRVLSQPIKDLSRRTYILTACILTTCILTPCSLTPCNLTPWRLATLAAANLRRERNPQ